MRLNALFYTSLSSRSTFWGLPLIAHSRDLWNFNVVLCARVHVAGRLVRLRNPLPNRPTVERGMLPQSFNIIDPTFSICPSFGSIAKSTFNLFRLPGRNSIGGQTPIRPQTFDRLNAGRSIESLGLHYSERGGTSFDSFYFSCFLSNSDVTDLDTKDLKVYWKILDGLLLWIGNSHINNFLLRFIHMHI